MLTPRLYFLIDTAFLMNGRDDRTSSGLIQNGRRPGGQVRVYALFEVEGELGVRQQVSIPVAASWRSPRDVHLPLNLVELHGFLIKILPASVTPQTCWG